MRAVIVLAAFVASPAAAEVVGADAHALHVRQSVQLVVPPAQAMSAFAAVSRWWSKDHTYSGDPANLSLDLRPGGCLCERLPKSGGVEHLRVVFVQPGEEVVFTGALGPLLGEAVTGVMTVASAKIAGGSRVTLDYKATGFVGADGQKFAPMVDAMLADTMKRYRAFATAGGGR